MSISLTRYSLDRFKDHVTNQENANNELPDQFWEDFLNGHYAFRSLFENAGRRYFVMRRTDPQRRRRFRLSSRERQVIELVAEGMKNTEIARQMKITSSTVGTYLQRAMRKLDAESRVDLLEFVNTLRKADLIPTTSQAAE